MIGPLVIEACKPARQSGTPLAASKATKLLAESPAKHQLPLIRSGQQINRRFHSVLQANVDNAAAPANNPMRSPITGDRPSAQGNLQA